jgi:hypothetical protein
MYLLFIYFFIYYMYYVVVQCKYASYNVHVLFMELGASPLCGYRLVIDSPSRAELSSLY